MGKKKTTHTRIYRSDLQEIRSKFPNMKMADFVHISIKTNPLIQLGAALKKSKKK